MFKHSFALALLLAQLASCKIATEFGVAIDELEVRRLGRVLEMSMVQRDSVAAKSQKYPKSGKKNNVKAKIQKQPLLVDGLVQSMNYNIQSEMSLPTYAKFGVRLKSLKSLPESLGSMSIPMLERVPMGTKARKPIPLNGKKAGEKDPSFTNSIFKGAEKVDVVGASLDEVKGKKHQSSSDTNALKGVEKVTDHASSDTNLKQEQNAKSNLKRADKSPLPSARSFTPIEITSSSATEELNDFEFAAVNSHSSADTFACAPIGTLVVVISFVAGAAMVV